MLLAGKHTGTFTKQSQKESEIGLVSSPETQFLIMLLFVFLLYKMQLFAKKCRAAIDDYFHFSLTIGLFSKTWEKYIKDMEPANV